MQIVYQITCKCSNNYLPIEYRHVILSTPSTLSYFFFVFLESIGYQYVILIPSFTCQPGPGCLQERGLSGLY